MKELVKKKSYVGLVFLIPFIMTLLGVFIYIQFSDLIRESYGLFMVLYFVSTGTIMLLVAVLQLHNEKNN